ncbi:diiron oxygenase, partial [Streptomyces sp. NRRL B-24572]|uniref:diiron oxygenase n=1 Tax=Streptomyces sp. NRRL B-24572 TaxID=1962156 RepID=UPI00117BFEB3
MGHAYRLGGLPVGDHDDVAEEARHISFAHEFLRVKVPGYGRARRGALSIAFPVIMRVLGDVIMV